MPKSKRVLILFAAALAALCSCNKGCMNKSSAWKFAFISDTQGGKGQDTAYCINKPIVDLIAADIVKEDPELVLVGGDLVNGWLRTFGKEYSEQYAQWLDAMKPVYNAGIKVYPVRGNHDDGPERLALPPLPARLEPPLDYAEKLLKAYTGAFQNFDYIPENGPEGHKRLTYSFTNKNAFFIALDVYKGGQHQVALDWIERQLAANKQPHVFVYAHEPAFEVKHKDNLAFYPKERDRFWDMLGRAGCRVYFCGHDHIYNRALVLDSAGNEIRQIIAGTGGGTHRQWDGVYKNPKVKNEAHFQNLYGYILATVDDNGVTLEWKAITDEAKGIWEVKDTFAWILPEAAVEK